jgi:hypothetical protein
MPPSIVRAVSMLRSSPTPESVPMACGPNVGQAGLYGFPVADTIGAPAGNQSRAW